MHGVYRCPAGDAARVQPGTVPVARPGRLDQRYLHSGSGLASQLSGAGTFVIFPGLIVRLGPPADPCMVAMDGILQGGR